MDHNRLIKRQFTQQTKQFSAWPPTGNIHYLKQLVAALNLSKHDIVLDVGCGTGELACCCAAQNGLVHGVDLTEGMIAYAQQHAQRQHISHVYFICADCEYLPYRSETFSAVISKSAFHHMPQFRAVFCEMVRCCRSHGLICLEDIVAYVPLSVHRFFDKLDTLIDRSHHARISKEELFELFHMHGIEILCTVDLDVEISVEAYRRHAVQSESDLRQLQVLVSEGLQDVSFSPFLYVKDGEPMFLNKGLRILGRTR